MDMTTPEARATYAELLRREEAVKELPRVVDFSRPQIPTGPPPRWFETPGPAAFHVVRKASSPPPAWSGSLPDIVD
ncbi:hypothetical protein VR44_06495 [Streptomyces katrae]|uniref:Uncharacterized protein n=1 Tax=Streptomyces katrae TaxID=68223 RepID=A0A0F4JSE7_9ACTN|nr:hypothetical protein VR44_06495 [Streptomyces katrae]